VLSGDFVNPFGPPGQDGLPDPLLEVNPNPPPLFSDAQRVCDFETSYASVVADISSPIRSECVDANETDNPCECDGLEGEAQRECLMATEDCGCFDDGKPDGFPDIITVNGSDFMRVLINHRTQPITFIDEAGAVSRNLAGNGWTPGFRVTEGNPPTLMIKADPSARIYHKPEHLELLGPLRTVPADLPTLVHPEWDLLTSLDDLDVGDLDGDGDLDIVVSNRDNFAHGRTPAGAAINRHNFIFRNDGRGSFDLFETIEDATVSTHDVALGDYDGDGDADLAMADDNGSLGAFLHNCAREWTEVVIDMTLTTLDDMKAALDSDEELDGDCRLLFAASQPELETDLLARRPAHEVHSPAKLFIDARPSVFPEVSPGNPVGTGGSHVSFEDFNGDGHPEIFYAGIGTARILWNKRLADGRFKEFVQLPSFGFAYSAASGDLNNDGRPDLVAVTFSVVEVYLNNSDSGGQPMFTVDLNALPPSAHATEDPLGWAAFGVSLADLDADGDLDLAVSQGDGGVHRRNRIFLNQLIPSPN
jgi:hypothetical protein